MDTKKIAELANIMKQNGLTKLDYKQDDLHIVLEAASTTPVAVLPAAPVAPVATAASAASPITNTPPAPVVEESLANVEDDLYEQKTPLVGTVYLAPQSDAAPYVAVGDHVSAGDTICIVESMKMFNEIAADCNGTIEEICVGNAQIVEYGQVLFRIRED